MFIFILRFCVQGTVLIMVLGFSSLLFILINILLDNNSFYGRFFKKNIVSLTQTQNCLINYTDVCNPKK